MTRFRSRDAHGDPDGALMELQRGVPAGHTRRRPEDGTPNPEYTVPRSRVSTEGGLLAARAARYRSADPTHRCWTCGMRLLVALNRLGRPRRPFHAAQLTTNRVPPARPGSPGRAAMTRRRP